MKLKMPLILTALAVLFLFNGCSQDDSPVLTADQPEFTPFGKSSPTTLINNFEVEFLGRSLANGNTIFAWKVSGTGVEPALSHFRVQLPDCAPEPISYSPTNSVSINGDPNTGLYGVEWHLNVESDDSVGRIYSLTFPGDVPLGEIYSSVSSGNETAVGIIPGPCQGYDIAGRIFVDGNENGVRDPDEDSGIANVIVELIDSAGFIQTAVTNQFGDYTFRKLEGTFTVNVPLDGYPDYFNNQLLDSFDATTLLSRSATVPPDSFDNNFGFNPQQEEIILELETGLLLSNGQTLKFWKSQFRAAGSNGNNNAIYDETTLLGFLAEIQGYALDVPYTFTPGNEIQEAYEILRARGNDPVVDLLAELLVTELNQAAGLGLIGQEDFQLVLIAWGEAVVAANLEPVAKGGDPDKAPVVKPEVAEATELFGLINTGGGGGIDE